MSRLAALLVVGLTGLFLALATAGAGKPPDFCARHPGNPNCATSSTSSTGSSTVSSSTTTTTTTTPVTTSSTGTLYADHDPATGVFAPWQRFQVGGTSYNVSDHPTGIKDPLGPNTGTIEIVDDPLGQQGKVFHLKTTLLSNFVSSNGNETLDRTDVWQNNNVAWNQPGKEIWEHFKVAFPAGQQFLSNGVFLFQHHVGGGGFSVPGDGIFMDAVVGTGTLRFAVGYTAGDVDKGIAQFNFIRQTTITTGRWYDIKFHIKWSTGSDGLLEWWVDDALALSRPGPTLAFKSSTGQIDKPNYEFSCYRHHATFDQHCYFSRLKIGSTQTTVADLGG